MNVYYELCRNHRGVYIGGMQWSVLLSAPSVTGT